MLLDKHYIKEFLRESFAIEGIRRFPEPYEMEATHNFVVLPSISIGDLSNIVNVYAPGAVLRDRIGLNVRIGAHTPIKGGPNVAYKLQDLLNRIQRKGVMHIEDSITPFEAHCEYEIIHPYTDGNGRSGRALWLWHMLNLSKVRSGHKPTLSFLHHFYYQTLDAAR